MEKKVTVKIANIGNAVGTVGWLAQQEIGILIQETEWHKPGCWLCVGEISAPIASVGMYWDSACGSLENTASHEPQEIPLFDDTREEWDARRFGKNIPWTNAAKAALEDLATKARKIFREEVKKQLDCEQDLKYKLVQK